MGKNKAIIVLENGVYFSGYGININKAITGELCFTTSHAGYQETITDPSYKGQILLFSFPHIGIVGINNEDYESLNTHPAAIVLAYIEEENFHYLKQNSFLEWININNIPLIYGIDTRSLITYVRESNTSLKAVISLSNKIPNIESLANTAKASKSLCNSYLIPKNKNNFIKYNLIERAFKYRIILIDFGVKLNIIRCLNIYNCEVYLCSPSTDPQEFVKVNPDGYVLSNGPGDPNAVFLHHEKLILNIINSGRPTLGICLGLQIIAVALGAKTQQMKNAHHGINHPIYDKENNKVIITSQNHEFHVMEETLKDEIIISHYSLFDNCIEGFKIKNKPIAAVQFHPEACPGPSDAFYIFEEFIKLMEDNAKKKRY